MGAPAVVAILRLRERQVVEDFRAAGAISPSTAQSYSAIGLGETLALRRLHKSAVIREASPGLYYLDEEVWAAVGYNRRRRAAVIISVLALMFLGLGLRFLRW
jgi:hypothetical protein